MAYRDEVIDHYENPRNVGALGRIDPSVGRQPEGGQHGNHTH